MELKYSAFYLGTLCITQYNLSGYIYADIGLKTKLTHKCIWAQENIQKNQWKFDGLAATLYSCNKPEGKQPINI